MHLTVFDVEHGGCALLTCDNGTRLMIDCGHNATTGWKPGDHLARLGITKLDMLFITNYDEDHLSGFSNLVSKVHVDWITRNPSVTAQVLKSLKSESGAGAGVAALVSIMGTFGASPNPQPQFSGVIWHAIWNNYPLFDDENNLSMVVHLSINNTCFLFPGDLETAGWRNLLANNETFRNVVRTTDVLVAAHHGRDNGICTELFDDYGCKPKIVVISDDYHQYDTQKTTAYYNTKCSGVVGFRGQDRRSVLTTRNDGTIRFAFNGQSCIVS